MDYGVGCAAGSMVFLWVFLIIVGILIDIWICVAAGNVAERKGYDRIGYILLTLFLGLIGLIITLCLPDRKRERHYHTVERERSLWQCRVCNQINKGGTYCSRCGHKRGA